jgi:hypothetical protein
MDLLTLKQLPLSVCLPCTSSLAIAHDFSLQVRSVKHVLHYPYTNTTDVISVRYHPPLSPSPPGIIIAYTLQIQAITVLNSLTIASARAHTP